MAMDADGRPEWAQYVLTVALFSVGWLAIIAAVFAMFWK